MKNDKIDLNDKKEALRDVRAEVLLTEDELDVVLGGAVTRDRLRESPRAVKALGGFSKAP